MLLSYLDWDMRQIFQHLVEIWVVSLIWHNRAELFLIFSLRNFRLTFCQPVEVSRMFFLFTCNIITCLFLQELL